MEIVGGMALVFITGFIVGSKVKEKEMRRLIRVLGMEYRKYLQDTMGEGKPADEKHRSDEDYPLGMGFLKELMWRYCGNCKKKQWSYSQQCKECNAEMIENN